MPVSVFDDTGDAGAATIELIDSVAAATLALHAPSTLHEATIVLTDDAELRRLNRTYRGFDRATDVLSFPMDPTDMIPDEPPYLGDVVISVNRARASADARGIALSDELRLLAVHGLLHLLGFEDETDDGALCMRRAEAALGVRSANDVD